MKAPFVYLKALKFMLFKTTEDPKGLLFMRVISIILILKIEMMHSLI